MLYSLRVKNNNFQYIYFSQMLLITLISYNSSLTHYTIDITNNTITIQIDHNQLFITKNNRDQLFITKEYRTPKFHEILMFVCL